MGTTHSLYKECTSALTRDVLNKKGYFNVIEDPMGYMYTFSKNDERIYANAKGIMGEMTSTKETNFEQVGWRAADIVGRLIIKN